MGQEIQKDSLDHRLKFSNRKEHRYDWNNENPNDTWDQMDKAHPSPKTLFDQIQE